MEAHADQVLDNSILCALDTIKTFLLYLRDDLVGPSLQLYNLLILIMVQCIKITTTTQEQQNEMKSTFPAQARERRKHLSCNIVIVTVNN